MSDDLLKLLTHELRHTPGKVSPGAAAMCKVVQHQLFITWKAQTDLRQDWRAMVERVAALDVQIKELKRAKRSDEA